MDRFAWDDAYNTGNAKIDEEHQRIFFSREPVAQGHSKQIDRGHHG